VSSQASVLNPAQRHEDLAKLRTEEFDALVVGGGVVGTGIALDAAARGLKVALIEGNDFASGTSSRSSKLIHGGLRYLEQFDFKLVREALHERELMVTTQAPHLVKPLSFLYPLHKRYIDRIYVGAGLMLYDLLRGTMRAVPWHSHISTADMQNIARSLDPNKVIGGLLYYDAQVDDARHTLMIARTAKEHGAALVTGIRCVGALRVNGEIAGAQVRDVKSGEEFSVKAKVVIGAAGIWNESLYEKFELTPGYKIKMSKGVHIILPKSAIDAKTGIILKTAISVLFIIPWGDEWLVGTTDTPYTGDRTSPLADQSDIEYIIHEANKVLVPQIRTDQVISTYAGLRPLVSPAKDSNTTKISREHTVDHPVPGFVSIAGGKYTTYRVMAKDAVDAAVKDLDYKVPASTTRAIPLFGADGYRELEKNITHLAQERQMSTVTITHLLNRYGSAITDLFATIEVESQLGELLLEGQPYIKAEVRYAVTHEGARSLEDVLERRLRISIESGEHGVAIALLVAGLIAPILGWSDAEIESEIATYTQKMKAEMASLDER
jgi:glycerol-3-phosphate dehydrogenase